MSKTLMTLTLGAAACGVCACSKDKEPETPQQQYQQGPYGQQPYGQQPYGQQQPGGYQQQPPPQQQQQPPPAGQPTGQAQSPIPTAQPGSPAQQLDPSAASAVTQLFGPIAAQQAPAGAQPVGSAIAGTFQQGQSLEAQIQLQPGKCYTVVGAGVPSVTELNIQLVAVTPLPGMAPVLAQDQDQGSQAVLGRKPNCYKWPMPVGAPVKVIVTVAAGSGIAGAQVYEK